MKRALTSLAILALLAGGTFAAGGATAKPRKAGPQTTWRFPVKGTHDFGGRQGRFGFKRNDGSVHAGQDVLASCGTRLVAAHRARVRSKGFSPATGHYIVLDGIGTKFDFVYAHLKAPARPNAGRTVKAGQTLGFVGDTGSSIHVCHLHFEVWSGNWFGGGKRVDPIKKLRAWDKFS